MRNGLRRSDHSLRTPRPDPIRHQVRRIHPLGLDDLLARLHSPAPSTPFTAAILASFLATAVEFLKLFRNPTLDAFRLTLPGLLLLGRFFSLWDIVAYCLAILVGAFADTILRATPPSIPAPLTRSS